MSAGDDHHTMDALLISLSCALKQERLTADYRLHKDGKVKMCRFVSMNVIIKLKMDHLATYC